MVENRLFNYTVKVIKYYLLIKLLVPIDFTFFWLVRLNLLVRLSTNPNHIKSKSYNGNSNINNKVNISYKVNISDEMNIKNRINISDGINNEILWAGTLPLTN